MIVITNFKSVSLIICKTHFETLSCIKVRWLGEDTKQQATHQYTVSDWMKWDNGESVGNWVR